MNEMLTPDILRRGQPVRAGDPICKEQPGARRALGPGVTLRSDGYTVVAKTSGMAMIEPDRVWLYPAMLVEEDLVAGRPLTATGNLIILGSIRSNAVVRATGSLGVIGQVSSAELDAADGCVLLSGCSHSAVRVGTGPQHLDITLRKFKALHESMLQLLSILAQLKEHPRFRTVDLGDNLRPLLEILVERQLSAVPFQVKEAIERCQVHQSMGGPVEELEQTLRLRFAGNRLLSITRSDVDSLAAQLLAAIAALTHKRDARAELTIVGEVVHSVIDVTGTVRVEAGSCRDCQVEAGIAFLAEGDIESGFVYAEQWVQAARITNWAGVQVGNGGLIKGQRIQGGTVMKVGNHSLRLPTTVVAGTVRRSGDRVVVDQGEGIESLG